eukprot:3940998-Rhodomonas_salina.6
MSPDDGGAGSMGRGRPWHARGRVLRLQRPGTRAPHAEASGRCRRPGGHGCRGAQVRTPAPSPSHSADFEWDGVNEWEAGLVLFQVFVFLDVLTVFGLEFCCTGPWQTALQERVHTQGP